MYYDNYLLEKKSLYLLKIRESISTEEKNNPLKEYSYLYEKFTYLCSWAGEIFLPDSL